MSFTKANKFSVVLWQTPACHEDGPEPAILIEYYEGSGSLTLTQGDKEINLDTGSLPDLRRAIKLVMGGKE